MPDISMREALIQAQAEELAKDSSVMIWGENIEGVGGGFMITTGLSDEFPGRVRDSPLAETAIAGSAVGAAYCGMRPIIEIMFADFVAVCFDGVLNQVSKVKFMSGDQFPNLNFVLISILCKYKFSASFFCLLLS